VDTLKVTRDVVGKIAELAQLQIRESEIDNVLEKMNQVLDLVEEMQAVDTDGVEPMAHPLDATQTLRADRITEMDERDHFQEIAPDTQDGLYLVPRVVE
jgi:aspartyl-tRNA(Asn)/glutamyl-tRNA(Gln) amidotransferase subunit C